MTVCVRHSGTHALLTLSEQEAGPRCLEPGLEGAQGVSGRPWLCAHHLRYGDGFTHVSVSTRFKLHDVHRPVSYICLDPNKVALKGHRRCLPCNRAQPVNTAIVQMDE